MAHRTFAVLIAFLAVSLAGCSGGTPASDATATTTTTTTAWLVADLPAGAVGVAEVKKSAKEGDAVIVRGKIGGRRDPVSKDSAVFIMMDPAIPDCQDRHGDQCPVPWDYCCETPESIAANNATVQIVDAAGRPLAIDVTTHGLNPQGEVIVVGTVGPRDTDAVLIIRATGVHVVKG